MFDEIGLSVSSDDFLPFVGMGEGRYIGGVAKKYDFSVDIEIIKKRTYDILLEKRFSGVTEPRCTML